MDDTLVGGNERQAAATASGTAFLKHELILAAQDDINELGDGVAAEVLVHRRSQVGPAGARHVPAGPAADGCGVGVCVAFWF